MTMSTGTRKLRAIFNGGIFIPRESEASAVPMDDSKTVVLENYAVIPEERYRQLLQVEIAAIGMRGQSKIPGVE